MQRLDPPAIEPKLSQQKPQNARNWLKTLRGLMKFAKTRGLVSVDPTAAIKVRVKGGRSHTWDEAEIEQYEKRHPVGTKARLAMALMLYSGQRKSDMARMGPQHIHSGKLFVRQKKSKMEKADEVLEIPVHSDLARIITASEIGNLAFLVTGYGKPFTAAGFGNKMREWCDEAGNRAKMSQEVTKLAPAEVRNEPAGVTEFTTLPHRNSQPRG
jgi:integrase